MKPITKSVIRKLFRMKLRLLGISMVISLAMAFFVAGFYGADVMDASIQGLLDEGKMPDLFLEFSDQEDEDDVRSALASSPDVGEFDLRLKRTGTYVYEDDTFLTIFIGVDDPGNQKINKLEVEDGKLFSASNEAIAVSGMQDFGVKEGETLTFEIAGVEIDLEITGTVRTPEYIFTSAFTDYSIPIGGTLVVIYMRLEDLQDIVGTGINDVIVILDEDGSGEILVDSLQDFELDSVTYQESHSSVTFLKIGTGKLKSMMPLMGTIFMFIGFISIFMTMMRLVQNDSRYVGVLMSLGYKKRDIVKTYLFLGIIICIIGSTIGIALSILITKGFVEVGMSMYMNMEQIILPFIPLPFIVGIIYTTVVVLFSVLIPIHYITRSSVREALEYKPDVSIHTSKSGFSKMSKMSLIGLRNTTRNPARLAITVFVIALTIGVAGSWLVMADSAFEYMSDQIGADTWDLRADFLTPTAVDTVDSSFLGMKENDASYIIKFSYLIAEVESNQESQSCVIIGCDEMQKARTFEVKEGELDFDKAVITNKMADDLKINVGDEISLKIGSEKVKLVVSGVVHDIMAYTMYTSKENLNSLFPEGYCSGAFIKLTNTGETATIADTLRDKTEISKVVIHSDISKTIDGLLEMANGFLYGFFVMSLLITIVVSASAVIISTMERDVEFATLGTLGISKRKIAKSILIEMAILSSLSAAIGIPASYVFAKLMAVMLESVVFYFPVMLTISASILIFIIGISFVLMSSVVPIRYSRKIDIEKTIRERTAG